MAEYSTQCVLLHCRRLVVAGWLLSGRLLNACTHMKYNIIANCLPCVLRLTTAACTRAQRVSLAAGLPAWCDCRARRRVSTRWPDIHVPVSPPLQKACARDKNGKYGNKKWNLCNKYSYALYNIWRLFGWDESDRMKPAKCKKTGGNSKVAESASDFYATLPLRCLFIFFHFTRFFKTNALHIVPCCS